MAEPAISDAWSPGDLLFLPLGGAGEIGMNLNLYGHAGKWLMVDLGITFADETMPGIDVVIPDPSFIEERREDLLGLILTHAHEDHLGAVPHLWPRLRCPVYATPFAATVLRRKLREHGLEDEVPLHVVPLGGSVSLPPFEVSFLAITHSILEPNALAIRTAAGMILHTGDWKLDPDPLVMAPTDEAAFRALGEEGVLAMVCDSTNALVEGTSGSEAEVRRRLLDLVVGRPGRVAITIFASNVARLKTIAEVARADDRHLVVVGRSLWRMIEAARETGYMDDLGPLLDDREGGALPPERVLYLCTGCQGEPRGAMARIASGGHREVVLEAGDTVIFSSRIIPGNERAIARMHNQLAEAGVEVISERDADVHVSGHPCREELAAMYRWVRPRIAVPVHGEMRHMRSHADLARSLQVPHAVIAGNGQILKLDAKAPEIVGEVRSGRLLVDGDRLVAEADAAIRDRRRMMFNGNVVATLVLDGRGELATPPAIVLQGLPGMDGEDSLAQAVERAVVGAVGRLGRAGRRLDGRIEEAARLAARRAIKSLCGKRPVVEVRVLRLEQGTMMGEGKG